MFISATQLLPEPLAPPCELHLTFKAGKPVGGQVEPPNFLHGVSGLLPLQYTTAKLVLG
jgi:hypothetical protein